MKKGKDIPNESEFPKAKKKTADKGKDIPVDLSYLCTPDHDKEIREKIGKSLRKIRKHYKLSTTELGNFVGVTNKTIEHYERGSSQKIDMIILAKCAEVFSHLPDKDGNYSRITLDALAGFTKYSSVDNEYIHDELGLDDKAIERLRQIKYVDDKLKAQQAKAINGNPSNIMACIVFNLRLPVINLFIKSKQLLRLINAFWRYTYPNDFLLPVYEDNKGKLQPIPYSDKYGGSVLLASDIDNMTDNIPLDLGADFSRALSKQQLDIMFNEISDEFYELHKKDPDKYVEDIFF